MLGLALVWLRIRIGALWFSLTILNTWDPSRLHMWNYGNGIAASVNINTLRINVYAINHWPIMWLVLIFLLFPVSSEFSCQFPYATIVPFLWLYTLTVLVNTNVYLMPPFWLWWWLKLHTSTPVSTFRLWVYVPIAGKRLVTKYQWCSYSIDHIIIPSMWTGTMLQYIKKWPFPIILQSFYVLMFKVLVLKW